MCSHRLYRVCGAFREKCRVKLKREKEKLLTRRKELGAERNAEVEDNKRAQKEFQP